MILQFFRRPLRTGAGTTAFLTADLVTLFFLLEAGAAAGEGFLLLAAGVLGFFTALLTGVATFLATDLGGFIALLLALGVIVMLLFFALLAADFFRALFLIDERCVFFAAGVSPLLLPMKERERFPKAEAAEVAGVLEAFLLAEAAGFLLPEEEAWGMGSEVVALAEPFQGERKPSTCVWSRREARGERVRSARKAGWKGCNWVTRGWKLVWVTISALANCAQLPAYIVHDERREKGEGEGRGGD